MFHAGLALELSRIIWDDRRAEAARGRSARGSSKRGRTGPAFVRTRQVPVSGRIAAPPTAIEDPWWRWRVVEPDAEYLRRRAA
jgi:hypothetical protein